MSDLDRRLELWIVGHRADALDPVFVGLSYGATHGAVWIAIAVAVAVALRRPLVVPLVALAVLGADVVSTALKQTVDRPRPPVSLPGIDTLVATPSSASFPSGHAATSFAAAVILCAALPRFAPLFLVFAAAVSYSRPYVGVHYPSDVLAGAVLGALVATALLLLVRALRRSRPRLRRDRPTARPPDSPSPRTRPESR